MNEHHKQAGTGPGAPTIRSDTTENDTRIRIAQPNRITRRTAEQFAANGRTIDLPEHWDATTNVAIEHDAPSEIPYAYSMFTDTTTSPATHFIAYPTGHDKGGGAEYRVVQDYGFTPMTKYTINVDAVVDVLTQNLPYARESREQITTRAERIVDKYKQFIRHGASLPGQPRHDTVEWMTDWRVTVPVARDEVLEIVQRAERRLNGRPGERGPPAPELKSFATDLHRADVFPDPAPVLLDPVFDPDKSSTAGAESYW